MQKVQHYFFIVNEQTKLTFQHAILHSEQHYEQIHKKALRNPFYYDFLSDAWCLFYCPSNELLVDPIRSIYLFIRKSILDIVQNDSMFKLYREEAEGNAELSLYYATLLCEATSLFFKENTKQPDFKQHFLYISSYYYTKDFTELHVATTKSDTPEYTQAQLAIVKQMYNTNNSKRSRITELFHYYAYQRISQLEVLALNDTSVLELIESNWTTSHKKNAMNP